MHNLTRVINDRIEILRNTISNAPTGGGLEKLLLFLKSLENDISSFIELVDKINEEN